MPGFVIGDGTQSNGRDKNEKKIIRTSQRNLLTATKIALFAFQFWGLARPPSPADTRRRWRLTSRIWGCPPQRRALWAPRAYDPQLKTKLMHVKHYWTT